MVTISLKFEFFEFGSKSNFRLDQRASTTFPFVFHSLAITK